MFKSTAATVIVAFMASSVPSAAMVQALSKGAIQVDEPIQGLTATSHRTLLKAALKQLLRVKAAQSLPASVSPASLRGGGGGTDEVGSATREFQYEDAIVPGAEVVDFKTALLLETGGFESELEAVNDEGGME